MDKTLAILLAGTGCTFVCLTLVARRERSALKVFLALLLFALVAALVILVLLRRG
jgi:hypothetical protein